MAGAGWEAGRESGCILEYERSFLERIA